MGEIMYEVNNSQTFINFKKREKRIRYMFIVIIIYVYVFGNITHYDPDLPINIHGFFFITFFYGPNLIIVLSSLVLLYNLKQNFNYEFKKQLV